MWVLFTSLVQGPLTSSGLTTLHHRCWHWTSDRSVNWADIWSQFSLNILTYAFSFLSWKKELGRVNKSYVWFKNNSSKLNDVLIV